MLRILTAAVAAIPLMAGVAQATPPLNSTYLGTDETSIRKSLESMGYVVMNFGLDESGFEAEILDNEQIYDVSVNPADGLVTNVELDTDVDGDA